MSAKFVAGQRIAEVGKNGASIKTVAAFTDDGTKFTLKGVNTKGEIEKSWREYDAETGVSVRKEYKGDALAQTFVCALPAEIEAVAEAWMKFEASQVKRVTTIADEVKNAATLAARAAAATLGGELVIGERKYNGKIGSNASTCQVWTVKVDKGYTARVKFFDSVAQEAYWSLNGRAGNTFESPELAIAVGKAILSACVPDVWTADKAATQKA